MKKRALSFLIAFAMLICFAVPLFHGSAAIIQPPVSFTMEQLKAKIDSLQTKPFVNGEHAGSNYTGGTQWSIESRYNYTDDQTWYSQYAVSTKYIQWNGESNTASDMAFIHDGWAVEAGICSDNTFPTVMQLKPNYNTTALRLVFKAPYSGIFKLEGDSLYPNIKAPNLMNGNDTYNNALNDNPIKFRITKNNVKIWPSDAEYSYFKIGDQVAFPTIGNLTLNAEDKVAIECYNPYLGYNTINGGNSKQSDLYLNFKPIVTFTSFSVPTDFSPLAYRQMMIDQFNQGQGYNPPVGAWADSRAISFTEDYTPWFTQVDYGDGYYHNASSIKALDGNGIPSQMDSYGYIWTNDGWTNNNVGFVDFWGESWTRINSMWAASPNNTTTTASLSFKAPSAGKYSIVPEDNWGYIRATDSTIKFRIIKGYTQVSGSKTTVTKVWPLDSDYKVLAAGDLIEVPTINDISLDKDEILAFQTVNDTGASYWGNLYIRAKVRFNGAELKFGTLGVNGSNYITKVGTGKTITDVLAQISGYASVEFKNKNGALITDNATVVGTGTTLNIGINGTNSDYTVVVYGDVDGNGTIGISDLAAIKSHLLKSTPLTGVYETAGKTSGAGQITISDLLAVKKQILGISTISQ